MHDDPTLVRDVFTVLGVWLVAFVALSYAFDLARDVWRANVHRGALRRRGGRR